MDSNLAHEAVSSVNGRKRKADAEEPQDSSTPPSAPSDPMLVDAVAAPNPLSNAPRQRPPSAPWLSPPTENDVWATDGPPISPLTEAPDEMPRCQKRPRIEREQSSLRPTKRLPRRQRSSSGASLRPPSCPPSRFWRRSDIRDMGIVPTNDSRRISDSLYHVKGGDPCVSECSHHLLPSPLPPINVCVITYMQFACRPLSTPLAAQFTPHPSAPTDH